MLDEKAIEAASKTLHDHWRAGTKFASLDDGLRPHDRIDGYAIQAGIEKYSSESLFGWKIAATARPDKSTSTSTARWPDASWPRLSSPMAERLR